MENQYETFRRYSYQKMQLSEDTAIRRYSYQKPFSAGVDKEKTTPSWLRSGRSMSNGKYVSFLSKKGLQGPEKAW